MFGWTLLLFVLAGGTSAAEIKLSDESILRNILLNGYEFDSRPVKANNKQLSLHMDLSPQYLTIDEVMDQIELRAMMIMMWTDEFLQWHPKDHGGIYKIQFQDEIWRPHKSVYMANPDAGVKYWILDKYLSYPCTVFYDGTVYWTPIVSHVGTCIPVQSHWPHEVLNCTLRFGSWEFTEEELRLSLPSPVETEDDYQENRQWALVSMNWTKPTKYKVYNETYPLVYLSVIVRKRSATHAAIVVVPAVALALLTIASGLMYSGVLGIGVALTSLAAHLFYVIEINWFIPLHGNYPDHIVTFLVDSALITAVTIIVYLMMVLLTKLTHQPPRLITVIINYAKAVPANIITFSECHSDKISAVDQDKDESSMSEEEQAFNFEWRKFATVFNNMYFYTLTVVYIVLACVYV